MDQGIIETPGRSKQLTVTIQQKLRVKSVRQKKKYTFSLKENSVMQKFLKLESPCLKFVDATSLLVQKARKLTLGNKISVYVPHMATAGKSLVTSKQDHEVSSCPSERKGCGIKSN